MNQCKGLNIIKNTCILMDLKINWSHRRCGHAIERMWLRGISREEVKQAVLKGQKIRQKTGLIEAFFGHYSVVFEEFLFQKNKIRKVYPVTVKAW